jgi:hypothetical protein
VGGDVAAVGPKAFVVGGVAFPGLEDAVVEIKTVHFCPKDHPVCFLGNGPAAGIYVQQLLLQFFEFRHTAREGLFAVVRRPIHPGRVFEFPPGFEQRGEGLVTGPGGIFILPAAPKSERSNKQDGQSRCFHILQNFRGNIWI